MSRSSAGSDALSAQQSRGRAHFKRIPALSRQAGFPGALKSRVATSSGRSMLGVMRRQFGFQDELERSVIFYRVSEFAVGGGEDGDDLAGVLTLGYGIADRKFGH
jgi:hypothetical protein